jgi:hypothetical protein
MTRKVLVSSDEATVATRQHTKPCGDCPWRRDSLAGWLGTDTPEEWLQNVHGEARIECHTKIGAQCAGAAIYRANVCKLVRDPEALKLPADRTRVFARPSEFIEHHDSGDQ